MNFEINFLTLFLIFAILVTADKGITAINVHLFNKNFPEVAAKDPYQIERNPIAKWSFEKFGLAGGTVFYWVGGILTLYIAFFLLSIGLRQNISLYILVMLYGLVIANNFYFMFKYARWIA